MIVKEGRHLDLGCGMKPRNPYGFTGLAGIDVHGGFLEESPFEYRKANLALESIPFEADSFDSVSAFDFIEHVPRQLAVDGQIRLPFVELMNEVHRVLKPGGKFYAMTPAFPSPKALVDPTHVNIITEETHEYFCGAAAYGRNYGFRGNFKPLRVEWVAEKNAHIAGRSFRKSVRNLHRRFFKGGLSHLLWELEAVK
ncbi:methyltransferase domain-containing protein [Paraburkholderia eburnea]